MLYASIETREFQEALDTLLNSPTFERAERLKRFLSFVCNLVLAGRSDEINEHLIGIEVFDRKADYTPSEDSIVRRQAHALRKKLEEYYLHEGRDSRVRIELPLGHYAATFHWMEEPETFEPTPAAVSPTPLVTSRLSHWAIGALIAAGVGLFLFGWLAGHASKTSAPMSSLSDLSPSMRLIWRSWLGDTSGVTICLTTPKTIVVKYYPEQHPDRAPEQQIPAESLEALHLRQFFGFPTGGEITEYPSIGQAKMGEAVAAVRLASLLASRHIPIKVQHSSSLGWDQVRNENLIVFGHSESTPWIDRLTAGYPVRTQPSLGALPRRITVEHPTANERSVYSMNEDHPGHMYVLISMLPGIDGQHRLLIVSGLSGMATQFGAEFLTVPEHVDALAAALRAAGAKPDRQTYFQAVLHVDVRDNTIPLKGNIELVRTFDRAPDLDAVALTASGSHTD